MKKLVLCLAAALSLYSCNKFGNEGETEVDPNYLPAVSLYLAATFQMPYNLDPFDVAFRLNVLLTECAKATADGGQPLDVNDPKMKTQRETLFGPTTTITSDQKGYYTITLQGQGQKDYLRTGQLEISTGGNRLIPGSIWNLYFSETNPYNVSLKSTASEQTSNGTIKADTYTITCYQENTWNLQVSNLVAKPEAAQPTNSAGSKWDGSFKIKQIKGDQTLAGLTDAEFTVEVPQTTKVVSAFTATELDVSTISTPLRYSAAYYTSSCIRQIIEGDLKISISGDPNLLNFAYVTWTYNKEKPNNPKIKLQFQMQDVALGDDSSTELEGGI